MRISKSPWLVDIFMPFFSMSTFVNPKMLEHVSNQPPCPANLLNKIGVGIFSDGITEFIRPETGKVHFQKILSKLKDEANYGGEKDYSKTFRELIDKTQEKLILLIISDFLNFTEKDQGYLKLLIKNFQVTGIMLRDPIEAKLPKEAGMICVEDINTTRQLIVNADEVADDYNEMMAEDELKVEKMKISTQLKEMNKINNINITLMIFDIDI